MAMKTMNVNICGHICSGFNFKGIPKSSKCFNSACVSYNLSKYCLQFAVIEKLIFTFLYKQCFST